MRKQPGAPLDVWNPEHATFVAAAYLEWLLERVGGDLRKAIAAYHWGIGHVMRVFARIAASSGRPRCRSRRRATSRGSWARDCCAVLASSARAASSVRKRGSSGFRVGRPYILVRRVSITGGPLIARRCQN